jgi:hypothetical protein
VLPATAFNTPAAGRCPSCGTLLQAVVFPALFAGLQEGKAGETLLVEGQSSCYYHPQKVAVVPCDQCGRFLCTLCELELGDRRVCPSCLESGQRKGKIEHLVRRTVLYDSLALWLSIVPVLMMWFLTFITAPVALFLALRHWGDPPTPLRKTRFRHVLAIVFSSVQIVAWCVGVYSFLT